MKINIKHILEGLKNTIFVREEVEKIAEERYSICGTCPKNSSNLFMNDPGPYYSSIRPDEHCTECACNLHAKVRSLHTACPLEKWLAVATPDEAVEVLKVITTNDDYEKNENV